MYWAHSHLLSISDLLAEDIRTVFQFADRFAEMADRPVKGPHPQGKERYSFFCRAQHSNQDIL